MNEHQATIMAAAEQERHNLLAQAAERHLSDLRDAARRYEAELAQIEITYKLRTDKDTR